MKASIALRKLLASVALVLVTAAAPAALTPQHQASLTASLQTLSSGWVQADVEQANAILSNASYTQADWQAFFAGYFAANAITDDLYNYLNYPVFVWFDAALHARLQNALLLALPARFEAIVAANRNDLGAYLQANPAALSTLHYINYLTSRALAAGDIDAATRDAVSGFYTQQIAAYPELWQHPVQIDVQAQPYVAILRAQIMINLVESLPLTAARKSAITQILGLSGAHQDIWNRHSLLVIDNHGLNATQLARIDSYLELIARDLHHTGIITVVDFFGTLGGKSLQYWIRSATGVNIFGSAVGTQSENGFPADIAARQSDLFGLVLVHEFNHMVDAHSVRGTPALAARWDQLLSQAGNTDLNYLRSQIGASFFQQAPGEFFASISNQWFADSAHTLALALSRWEAGHAEPLNQFLAFADVHAQAGVTLPFYSMDTDAVLTRTDVPVQYDGNGRIAGFSHGGQSYQFSRDAAGNVVEAHYDRPCLEFTATNSAHVTAGRAYTQTTGSWFKTTTWYALGSNQSLGTSGFTSTRLSRTGSNYYVKGGCPSAPTIGTPSAAVSGRSVTVSGSAADANGSLTKVEVEFDGNGVWIAASGTSSWTLTKADLPVGAHSVRARASNAANLVSPPSAAVAFTTVEAPASVCFTAKNTLHISEGRAHQCGTLYSPQACANGSNTNLGSSSSYFAATTSLEQTGPNHWMKVSNCPL